MNIATHCTCALALLSVNRTVEVSNKTIAWCWKYRHGSMLQRKYGSATSVIQKYRSLVCALCNFSYVF